MEKKSKLSVHQLGSESAEDTEVGNFQENDAFTLQSSFLGSISTLQLLFDGDSEDGTKVILSDEQPNPDSDTMEMDKKAGNISDIFLDPELMTTNQDDTEYWIVGEECELNDGWLVVSDD